MLRRGRLNLIRGAIVLFWLLMTGLLLRQEWSVPRAAPEQSAEPREYETWMGVYAGEELPENQIGYVRSSSILAEREGVRGNQLGLTVKLSMNMFNAPAELLVSGNAWSPLGQGLRSFEFQVESFDQTMTATGNVKNGALDLSVNTGAGEFPITVPVGEDLMMQGSFGASAMNLPVLEVGDEVMIDTFDPVTFSRGSARVKCVDTETLTIDGEQVATRVMTTTIGNITTTAWVTGDDEVVRIETPYGLVLSKLSESEAIRNLNSSGTNQLIESMAIRPAGKAPFRGARTMTVRIDGLPPSVHVPEDHVQRSVGDRVYSITPPQAPDRQAEADPAFGDGAEFLGADPFIQTEHEEIRAKAAEITEGVTDPWAKALQLYQWVFDTLDKTIVLSFPSAVDVLRAGEGDCNEHTVLFTALARAADIPTRVAIGIVWSEDLEGFYYHAWPEVWVGAWIPMEPTLGEPIADATHIKLLNGSIESWPRLMPFLGQMELEVIDVE